MIDALISGKLAKDPISRTGPSGKPFTNFSLIVPIPDAGPMFVSGIAFGDAAEKLSRLKKGDPVCVVGSLKPSEWTDKTTGEIKHGLNITTNHVLSVYDIQKRRRGNAPSGAPASPNEPEFDDVMPF